MAARVGMAERDMPGTSECLPTSIPLETPNIVLSLVLRDKEKLQDEQAGGLALEEILIFELQEVV